jgi:hypothetical protein
MDSTVWPAKRWIFFLGGGDFDVHTQLVIRVVPRLTHVLGVGGGMGGAPWPLGGYLPKSRGNLGNFANLPTRPARRKPLHVDRSCRLTTWRRPKTAGPPWRPGIPQTAPAAFLARCHGRQPQGYGQVSAPGQTEPDCGLTGVPTAT